MSIFDRYLNTTGSSGAGFNLVDASNPLQWTKLGWTFIASLLAGIVIGIQRSIDAVFAGVERLFRWATGWVYSPADVFRYPGGKSVVSGESGLIVVLQEGLEGIMFAAWAPVSGLGWLAWPVAVAEVLVMLYLIEWSISYVREGVV